MRVSVICLIYNTASALLRAAAHFVLSETEEAVAELLLFDDASTDPNIKAALAELARAARAPAGTSHLVRRNQPSWGT